MVRAAAKRLRLMEAAVYKKCFGSVLRYDVLWRGTDAAIASRPIDNEDLAAWLECAAYLGDKTSAILDLEECVGQNDGIESRIAQVSAARFLDVAPDGFDNLLVLWVRIQFEVLQHVFLHIDRVDPTPLPHDTGRCTRVVAAPGAEIADRHIVTQAKLEKVLLRRSKVRAHTYKIPCGTRNRPHNQHLKILASEN